MSDLSVNFIPCVNWVKRGVSKRIPEKLSLTREELKRVIDQTKQKLNINDDEEMLGEEPEEGSDAGNEPTENMTEEDDIERRYNLAGYDDEEDEDNEDEEDQRQAQSLANLTVYASNEEDPYIDRTQEDSDEEREDFEIKPTDNLLLVGHIEKDAAILEVQVYNEEDQYVHHDIILGYYPLCLEWINYDPNREEPVNHLAMGDMSKDISIWDLDVVNCLEPAAKLSGHEDAVLSMSWNKGLRNVLASGSADGKVILWDLKEGKAVHIFDHFQEKVQSIRFHPQETGTLLIGDCNGVVTVADCKNFATKQWKVPKILKKKQEIENVIWNHFESNYFFAATDTGSVYCYDYRSEGKPVYSIKAHSDSVIGLALSSSCPGCLVTASSDKALKVWDVDHEKASFILEVPKMKIGSILALSANPDLPFVFAVGGDSKSDNLRVIDISRCKAVHSCFTSRALQDPEGNSSTNTTKS